ncbi:MAG: Gfo/Idh/MocA family oxidoreductase [Planctomycetales bacterium]|nr:Gfo/Idh/MocA family oxidoreductase [Planctomycetales bacterium]
MKVPRRTFSLGGLLLAPTLLTTTADQPELRVAVIGHTGRGNYGHGLDSVWQKIAGMRVVAVADADPVGLTRELSALQVDASSGYTNFREMLDKIRPDIVAVCPRHPDQHRDMIVAAIESGAQGIYVEKPYVRTPAEADAISAALVGSSCKVAVAHRNRYHPVLHHISELVQTGKIGRLLEIRGRGKGDRRGGAEDLWVLGSHVLNMMTFLAGAPLDCSATMLANGRPVTKLDVREGAEGLGLLAGNEVHARFRFDSGVTAYFDSVANDQTNNEAFGLQLIGSEGVIAIQADREPLAYLLPGNPFRNSTEPRHLQAILPPHVDPVGLPELVKQIYDHRAAAQDLVEAMLNDRQPLCNHHEASLTVEMICAVFESHRSGGATVGIPMRMREHPLSRL